MPVDRLTADAQILRGLAHPLRRALLDELYARGEATATTLAGAVDRPVNAVSFHLRELSRYGLIEPAENPGGDARQRWWRPASTGGVQVGAVPGWGSGDDTTMLLTSDEAEQYAAEVRAVMGKWRDHGRRAAAPDAESEPRRTYVALSLVLPHSPAD
ncbi:MAG: ArsR/SmtB family transcription factor [Nocardioidaceae bacterium]